LFGVPHFDIITLFPDEMPQLLALGVVGRALKRGLFTVRFWSPRDFTEDVHRTVDDRPYGGGPGMVMMAEPLAKALVAIQAARQQPAPVVFFTPHGPLLKQSRVRGFIEHSASAQGLVLLCGRYEGVDQRFIDRYVDHTLCLGDFILSGGELPAACFVDAWVRLLPGVLNHECSAVQESFEQGVLDCPHYTRPEHFEGERVPEVLLSGNHAKIESWRFEQAVQFTKRFRPDIGSALPDVGEFAGDEPVVGASVGAVRKQHDDST
jgi:tRNA (guanine37-N1)-methyltransferase